MYFVHDMGTCSGTAGLRGWAEFLWLAQSPVRFEVSIIDNVADDGNASLDVGEAYEIEEVGREKDLGSDGSGISAYGPISLFARGADLQVIYNLTAYFKVLLHSSILPTCPSRLNLLH